MEHGCQPRLSVVYYSTARLSAETTVVYCSTARLPAKAICSILQYSTAISRGYLQYTIVQRGCQPRLLQYIVVQHGYQPRLLQYTIVQHGCQPRLLQYTIIQHGCQPRLLSVYCQAPEATVVYCSTTRLSAQAICSILLYSAAVSRGYLQYTIVQHGCQPRLVQYTIVQHGCQPRLLQYTVVHCSTTRLSAKAICSILQYNTAVSRGYCSTLYSTARLSAETAVVYYSTARLSADVTCSILQYNTAVSLSYLQYTGKNAQVVTSLQTSCNKFVHKLSTSCFRTACCNKFGTSS